MLIPLIAFAALAAPPVDVDPQGVPVGTPSERVTLGKGSLLFTKEGGRVTLYVTDGEGVSFSCTEWGLKQRWRSYETFFRQVARDAPTHPNADFGSALTGMQSFSGSSAAGYCNVSASTREGTLIVIFQHNRACFGSAGCNSDTASFVVKPDDLLQLAGWFATSLGD